MPTCARFPRSARLTAASDYDAAFKSGQRHHDPLFGLHWRRGDAAARLGLAVSRKVDRRAVVRNRIKRALRQQFRLLRADLAGGDYVFVARAAAAQASPAALAAAMQALLQRVGALPRQSTPAASPGTMRSAANAAATCNSNPDVPTHDPMPASDAG
ncbi:ribonuclease P protein component [Luteimonas cucumeris]|uniref:Ribonuclease P protein component n=1 Tax=Luteimonas cucumeris TaxID=985012 RepID=A0A562KVP5_9GAMM|nr:ribonuclease P protein component [Luteimonas cucumeris]TWH99498.1 ribonuclease P protein component [Luteimonas cucumeris]